MPVITHNMLSQFTNRQLNITDNKKSKSSEKLSSGYRINRASDDAAGLAISEKLRWQVRGLNRASLNISDGISICQVAEGALHEDHAILQRMRELSIQAASDTNTDKDRQAIQWEIEALAEEVDRVAENTEFNKEIFPLKGSYKIDSISSGDWQLPSYIAEYSVTYRAAGNNLYINGEHVPIGERRTLTGIALFNNTKCILANGVQINDYSGGVSSAGHRDTVDDWYDLRISDLKIDTDGAAYYISHRYNTNWYLYYNPSKIMTSNSSLWSWGNKNAILSNPNNELVYAERKNVSGNITKGNLWIQMGAKSGQGMYLSLVDATAKEIGLTDPPLDVTSFENANDAVTRLENAIDKVSTYRSTFGAQQNRLEYGKTLDDLTAENSQTAESRIRDTDMASEMVNQFKHNMLQQAGQSMLAQANQIPNGVLQLLQ